MHLLVIMKMLSKSITLKPCTMRVTHEQLPSFSSCVVRLRSEA